MVIMNYYLLCNDFDESFMHILICHQNIEPILTIQIVLRCFLMYKIFQLHMQLIINEQYHHIFYDIIIIHFNYCHIKQIPKFPMCNRLWHPFDLYHIIKRIFYLNFMINLFQKIYLLNYPWFLLSNMSIIMILFHLN